MFILSTVPVWARGLPIVPERIDNLANTLCTSIILMGGGSLQDIHSFSPDLRCGSG